MSSAAGRELSPRARAIGVVVWASFLAASVGTLFFFAFVAPDELVGAVPDGSRDHLGVYTLGFFGLWLLAALASALSLYLFCASVPARPPAPPEASGEPRV